MKSTRAAPITSTAAIRSPPASTRATAPAPARGPSAPRGLQRGDDDEGHAEPAAQQRPAADADRPAAGAEGIPVRAPIEAAAGRAARLPLCAGEGGGCAWGHVGAGEVGLRRHGRDAPRDERRQADGDEDQEADGGPREPGAREPARPAGPPPAASRSRAPPSCPSEPTVRKASALASAWKASSSAPAASAAGVPRPAAAAIRPRLEIVEKARTRLRSCSRKARSAAVAKAKPPRNVTAGPRKPSTAMAGESRSSRYEPAFTIVLAWSSADTGAAATIAPSSQGWKGVRADFVAAARTNPPRISGSRAGAIAPPAGPPRGAAAGGGGGGA